MSATTIRVTTAARYQGLTVTILGNTQAGLLAVAGYGTPHEIAIATIAVKHRRGQHVFCVAGTNRWTTSLDEVARAAVRSRQARDSQ